MSGKKFNAQFNQIIEQYSQIPHDEKSQDAFQDDMEELAHMRFDKKKEPMSFLSVQHRRYAIVKKLRQMDTPYTYLYNEEDHTKYKELLDCSTRDIPTVIINEDLIDKIIDDYPETEPSDKYFFEKMVVNLQAVSGRRIGELLKTFIPYQDKVLFKALKKRGDIATAPRGSNKLKLDGVWYYYFIPYEISPEMFMYRYIQVEDMLKRYNANALTKKINRFLNIFGISTHKLRALYLRLMMQDVDNHLVDTMQGLLNHANKDSLRCYDYIQVETLPKNKYKCKECSSVVLKKGKTRHERTKKHLNAVANSG